MIGTLSMVATPIGNLGDISQRALDVLESVDVILCEDTRVTRKLLQHYEIDTQCMSYHQHSDDKKVREIAELLKQGKNMALVSDAGTPGISDPGNRLIADLSQMMPELQVFGIPGASAMTVALSVSGFPTDKFTFMGFIPHKNKRKKFLEEVRESKYTSCFFESCHRIEKCIKEMKEIFEGEREVVICRELTKKFETTYRGSITDIAAMDIPTKGEFVVVVRAK
ncbi:16S rRNA (cytidine(1402)-2'-O)-methyltransferase [Candidatus Nomurabacteria bacterium]|nr:16S rRNA (cytidine(1402)-2'-O)-methyltransferase [Candidatus Nomurabacteria bacterium]